MLKLSWASNIGSCSSNEDNLLFCGSGLREACLPLEHRIDSGKRLLLSDAPLLCALADGLGGEDEGGQAARTALLRLSEAYEEAAPEHTRLLSEICTLPPEASTEDSFICVEEAEAAAPLPEVQLSQPPASRLYQASQEAAAAVCQYYRQSGGTGGCTLAAAVVEPQGSTARVVYTAAGDSCIFHFHHGSIRSVNLPENLFEEHRRRALPAHPLERGVLLNYLGHGHEKFQTGEFTLTQGDRLLICSDGVCFGSAALRLLISCRWIDAEKLTSLAVGHSTHSDNASALLIDF